MLDAIVETRGLGNVLRFERRIAKPVARVWAALTDPARIADWLGAAEVEPRVGGRYVLRFHSGGTMEGVIRRIEPQRRLEYSWREGSRPQSVVTWELEPDGDGCRLVLIHSFPASAPDLADFASGWHWHLDAIPAAADGVATPWSDAAWAKLKLGYAEALAISSPPTAN